MRPDRGARARPRLQQTSDRVVSVDVEGRRARVEPGVVLDRLNRRCASDKLFFPVDVSTASRATIGGMTANNSCGSRSLRYGNMVHNVRGIDALLADGTAGVVRRGARQFRRQTSRCPSAIAISSATCARLHRREADEIEQRFPKLLRRVGGYNIDMIDDTGHNMAQLLVGSEGTLAFFNEIELDLQPIPAHRVLGICHFPTFYRAMAATKAIVELGPQRGRAGRPHDDRAVARHPDVPRRSSTASCRASPRRCCWSNSPATTRPKISAPEGARRADGRSRLSRRVVEAIDPAFQRQSGRCARRASTS